MKPKVDSRVPAAPELPRSLSDKEATWQVDAPAVVGEVEVVVDDVAGAELLVADELVGGDVLFGLEQDVNPSAIVTPSAPPSATVATIPPRDPEGFRS